MSVAEDWWLLCVRNSQNLASEIGEFLVKNWTDIIDTENYKLCFLKKFKLQTVTGQISISRKYNGNSSFSTGSYDNSKRIDFDPL